MKHKESTLPTSQVSSEVALPHGQSYSEQLVARRASKESNRGSRTPKAFNEFVLYLAFALLLIDALGGPLRYYLDQVGLEGLVYLPKLMAVGAVGIAMLQSDIKSHSLWLAFGLLVYGWMVALAQGVAWQASAFMVFLVAPLYLGLITRVVWDDHRALILKGLAALWLLSVIGVVADAWFHFPWSGQHISTMGHQIEINRFWITENWERYAGFTRVSSNAAFYIGLTGVLLAVMLSRTSWRVGVWIVTFACVLMTTNKAMIGSLMAVTLLWCLNNPRLRIGLIACVAVTAVLLPLSSAMMNLEVRFPTGATKLLFDSFGSRISNTWPDFLGDVSSYWVGQGLGGVGTPDKMFGPDSHRVFADNFSLYLMGLLGVPLGLLVFGMMAWRTRLVTHPGVFPRAMGAALFVTICAGITTDVIESVIAAYLLGVAMSLALQPAAHRTSGNRNGSPVLSGGQA